MIKSYVSYPDLSILSTNGHGHFLFDCFIFPIFQEIWTESDHMLLLSKSAGIMIEPS